MRLRFLVLGACVGLFALPPGARAADVTVTVDFGSPTGKTATRRHYGLNTFEAYSPESTKNKAFRSALSAMNPGLFRFHTWEMLESSSTRTGWVKTAGANPTWDAAKIKAALADFSIDGDVVVNIPTLPGADAQKLAGAKLDAFAAFCAELVRIINIDAKKGFVYWEIPNEQEDAYSASELSTLVMKVGSAMKKVDPTIKIGGPALIQPWAANADGFFQAAASQLDFISYHLYAGAPGDGDLAITLKRAAELGSAADDVRARIAKITDKKLELFHDEWNIAWSGPDDRMTGPMSAQFDALALASIANSAADGAAAWNDSDGWYGKMEGPPGFARRPASFVFELYAKHLSGAIVKASSSANATVSVFAVRGAKGNALSLVNRTSLPKSVSITLRGDDARSTWSASHVKGSGIDTKAVSTSELDMGIVLPANGVAVLFATATDTVNMDASPPMPNPMVEAGVGTGGVNGGVGANKGSASGGAQGGAAGEEEANLGGATGMPDNSAGAAHSERTGSNGCSYANGPTRSSSVSLLTVHWLTFLLSAGAKAQFMWRNSR